MGEPSLDAARRMSHGEQLARAARKHPDRVALICGDVTRTFAELDDNATRIAAGLAAAGVQQEDRVALLMRNSIEMAEALFAGWRLGATVVPINFRLTADEVAFQLGDAAAAAVVVDADLLSLVGDLRPAMVHGSPVPAGTISLAEVLASAPDGYVAADVDEAEPALIAYTSGTTGRPKGAMLSHRNLVMQTLNSMVQQGIGGYDDVWYVNIPLFHIGGLTGLLPYVMAGGTSVIVPSGNFSAAAAVDDLVRYGVTGCVFIGMQWDEVCDELLRRRPEVKLRRASWGAANTPVHVLSRIAEALPGVPLSSYFGQTEMSPVTCVLGAEHAVSKRGSVGRPIINVEARIVDDFGNDVRPGEVGEIVYRGPTVMLGYWRRPEATAEAFAGGWFHSGDLCRIDEDGFIYVVDRKDDMIVSGGENIYCPEVETALGSHPGVAEAAVVGVPHPRWGQTPLAVVVAVDATAAPDPDDLIAWCRERIASYKKPTAIVFADALPRNAGGKVLKGILRQRYGSGSKQFEHG